MLVVLPFKIYLDSSPQELLLMAGIPSLADDKAVSRSMCVLCGVCVCVCVSARAPVKG